MEGQRLLFVKLVILIVGRSSAERCDRATTARVQEGNLGQSADFNWLGVLHVHLHDEDKIRVAMTGIVLIKMKHALANADDVVRIPQQIFKTDSKAMFLVARDTPWFAKPQSYVTHPEYEYSTLNTIAIVELNLDDVNDFPLNPICIPTGETFNTSRHLYLTGFTDENQKMEKVIYNIQYLDKKACEEFYNRAGLSSQKRIPSAYLCGYAPSNVTQCVWDNGMALVSNVTGYFHLIGFGIHGPGCAAPARFIDLFPYFSWIKSVTSPAEYYDDAGYRRKEDDEFIPIHELFTVNGTRRVPSGVYKHEFERYPFFVDPLQHHKISPTDKAKAVLIFPFNDTWEQYQNACKLPKALMYTEYFEVKAHAGTTGVANYMLSLYDLQNTVCACVRMTVDCDNYSEAVLSFKEVINFKEGTQLNRQNTYKTPEDLLKSYVGIIRTVKPKQSGKWEPNHELLKPVFINDDDIIYRRVLNYDLYIQFKFTDRAILKFEMFAEPGPLDPSRIWPIINRTDTEETNKTAATNETETAKTTVNTTTVNTTTVNTTTVNTTTTPHKMGKLRVQTTAKTRWGIVNWADHMSKQVEVDCDNYSEAVLSFKEVINFKEGTQLNRQNTYKTPEDLLKSYVGIIRTVKPKQSGKWEPNHELLKPVFINDDDIIYRRVLNYDLYIQFKFTDRAILKFEMFAEPGPLDPSRIWPIINRTDTEETNKTAATNETETAKTTVNTTTVNTTTVNTTTVNTTTTPHKMGKLRVQTTAKTRWGIVNWADHMSKQVEVSLMADVQEVQETESAARSEEAPGAVVMVCWLVSACLKRAFYNH